MAEKKKPKPGPSTGGSSKSRIKRPKGSQPLTLGTGGLRTGKVSKKQQAGTRKVVGAIAAATPAGRVAKAATKGAKKVAFEVSYAKKTKPMLKRYNEALKKQKYNDKIDKVGPKQPKYPSNLVSVKNKPSKTVGLETRGKRRTREDVSSKASNYLWNKKERTGDYGVDYLQSFRPGSKNYRLEGKALKVTRTNNKRINISNTPSGFSAITTKADKAANKRGLKAANKKK
jgi:hypothetical protein